MQAPRVHGRGPLHRSEVFGTAEKTVVRYADSTRALLPQTAETAPAS
ncbi:hypothetical protein [Streptomyces sp. NPDC046821]